MHGEPPTHVLGQKIQWKHRENIPLITRQNHPALGNALTVQVSESMRLLVVKAETRDKHTEIKYSNIYSSK